MLPDYAPVDEEHPIRPQDPYATAKHFSELLMDAAMRRSDIRCLTIRPSWVQWEGNYAHNLGPALRDPEGTRRARACGPTSTSTTSPTRCASPPSPTSTPTRSSTSPRPTTTPTARSPTSSATTTATPIEIREPLPRPDASGLSIAKAQRLLGYAPTRSWRDYLDEDGDAARRRRASALERGDTGVQRGRAVG